MLEPTVFLMSGGIKEELSTWEIPKGYKFFIAYIDDKIAGMFHYKNITAITLEVHISILPEYHGTSQSLELGLAGFDYARDKLKAHKLVSMVWSDNERCIKYCMKLGYTVFANLRNAVIHNNKYHNMVYLEHTLENKPYDNK